MSNKIFIDANILLDYIDISRVNHKSSKLTLEYLLKNRFELFTSCDLITTIYYVLAKKDKDMALSKIKTINNFCTIVEFSNKEIVETCALMERDYDYADLEDTIQYILAKKQNCYMIISNDKKFVAKELQLLSSLKFCKDNCLD